MYYQILNFNYTDFLPLGEKAIIDIWVVFKAYSQDWPKSVSIAPLPRIYDIRKHSFHHLEVLDRLLEKGLILMSIHIIKEADLITDPFSKDRFFLFIVLSLAKKVLVNAVYGI